MLALANFKRRPRQPSLLRMVQQTSDVDRDDSLDGLGSDDLDDFDPEDESTPLKLGKGQAGAASAATSMLVAASGDRAELQTSSTRKRRFSSVEPEVQVPCSSPPATVEELANERSVALSDSPSLPEQVDINHGRGGDAQQQHAHAEWSDTMAPPRSSSPTRDDDAEHDASKPQNAPATAPKRRGRPPRNPAPQHKPADNDTAKTRRPVKTKPKPAISTAALESMLPRRRRRARRDVARDAFDIPTSSEGLDATVPGEDDDELLLPAATKARRGPPGRKAGTGATSAGTGGAKRPRGRPRKVKDAAAAAGVDGGATGDSLASATDKAGEGKTRTYGKASSDKENGSMYADDEGDDDGGNHVGHPDGHESSMTEVSGAKELVAAAEKFKDVDAWEMEFESVDATGGSSSPWR